MSMLVRPSPTISAPSCTVACSCMLRWARAASDWEAAAGMRHTREILQPRQLVLDAAPPDLGGVAETVHADRAGLAAGFGQRLVVRLADLDPQPRVAGEIAHRHVRVFRVGQARAESQRGVAAAFALDPVRVERQGGDADHHALVGFAGVTRQRQRVVRVVAVVDVGDREARLEDGGLQRQARLFARVRRPCRCRWPASARAGAASPRPGCRASGSAHAGRQRPPPCRA